MKRIHMHYQCYHLGNLPLPCNGLLLPSDLPLPSLLLPSDLPLPSDIFLFSDLHLPSEPSVLSLLSLSSDIPLPSEGRDLLFSSDRNLPLPNVHAAHRFPVSGLSIQNINKSSQHELNLFDRVPMSSHRGDRRSQVHLKA